MLDRDEAYAVVTYPQRIPMDTETQSEQESTELVEGKSRSMVSLDHNGQSTRVVCIGGRNVISLGGRLGELAESQSISVTNVAWPGIVFGLVLFAAGAVAGHFLLEALREFLAANA